MLKNLLLVGIAFTLTGIAIFSVQNASPTVISFLFWQSVSLPLGIVLALSLAIGLLIPIFLI